MDIYRDEGFRPCILAVVKGLQRTAGGVGSCNSTPSPSEVSKRTEAYMRGGNRDLRRAYRPTDIAERRVAPWPAAARYEPYVAVATAADRFIVIEAPALSCAVQLVPRGVDVTADCVLRRSAGCLDTNRAPIQ